MLTCAGNGHGCEVVGGGTAGGRGVEGPPAWLVHMHLEPGKKRESYRAIHILTQ